MKKATIVSLMALVTTGACAGKDAETAGYQVTVYVKDQQIANPLLLLRAKALTTSMFAGIGVRLRWELSVPRPTRGRQALTDAKIVLRFASGAPVDFHPGAMAYSRPYAPQSEVRVTILYDRVLGAVQGDFDPAVARLGHVLAHEITHVLQGVVRHSETGLMKAHWTPDDRAQMSEGPLPFTPHDAELIKDAMAPGKYAAEIAVR